MPPKLSASHTNQNLSAATRCMVDMPIIAATRLERDVKNINLLLRQRLQIALSGENTAHNHHLPAQSETASEQRIHPYS